MPAFESLISSAPSGFSISCKKMNILLNENEDEFYALINQLNSLSELNDNSIRNKEVYSGLKYIHHSIKEAVPKPDNVKIATALDSFTFLHRKTIEVIVTRLDVFASEPVSNNNHVIQIVRVV